MDPAHDFLIYEHCGVLFADESSSFSGRRICRGMRRRRGLACRTTPRRFCSLRKASNECCPSLRQSFWTSYSLTIRDCRPSLAMAHILCSRFAYFFAAYPMLLMMYTYKVVTLSEKRKYFRQYLDDCFKTSSTKRMFNLGNLCTIHALWPYVVLALSHSESHRVKKQKLHDLKMDLSNAMCHFHLHGQ